MPTLVLDPKIEKRLLKNRRAWGGDKFDEVWDGVYVMAPLPNVEHQELMHKLNLAFGLAFSSRPDVRVFPGVNVSDRKKGWRKNYRCPDVAIVLPGSRAVNCGAFYFGGPDFALEIISDYDRSREKLDFYAKVGVRELLLIDRNPWQLELYRLAGTVLTPAGAVQPANPAALTSEVLPLSFRLLAGTASRPQIEIVNPGTGERWLA